MYGDLVYNERWFLDCPFRSKAINDNHRAFKAAMARTRVIVQCIFTEVKLYWTIVDIKSKLNYKKAPLKHYRNAPFSTETCALLSTRRKNPNISDALRKRWQSMLERSSKSLNGTHAGGIHEFLHAQNAVFGA